VLGTPRFAVLLCTHNGAGFLEQQLRSLSAQTVSPQWMFVHDWGSSDGTRELIQRWQQAASSPTQWQVVLHDHAPGPCQSFLQSTAQCLDSDTPFDYLFFCDQDDLWHSEKLQAFAQALAGRQDVDLMYSDVALIDAAGALVAPTYLQAGGAFGRPMDMEHGSCLFVSTVSGMSMALSRSFLQRTRSVWARPGWHMHDWAMSICAYLSRARVVFIPRALVNYRQHGANLVGGTGPGSGRAGVGQRRQASGIWSALVRARRYVLSVHRQYQSCVNAPKLPAWRQIPAMASPPMVALAVLRGRSLPLPKRLKVALGYLVLWPWR
jgi:rhamnosyltransferase